MSGTISRRVAGGIIPRPLPPTAHRTSHRDRTRLGVQGNVACPPFNQRAAVEHFSFSIVLSVALV